MSTKRSAPESSAVRQLRAAVGSLTRMGRARIEADRAWFAELSAADRAWVGEIVHAGVRTFVDWYADGAAGEPSGAHLAADVFGAAPRALTGVITLQQTVDLVRLAIDEVEQRVDEVIDAEDAPDVHAAILRYAREVAFATAEVYARAAEVRGAWDARLEALVVDGVLRAETDETVLSRASAVGWAGRGAVAVVVGPAPADHSEAGVFAAVRRSAGEAGLDALCAVQGHLLVVILGGVGDPERAGAAVVDHFAPGPVVVGPVAADLGTAHASAEAAFTGLRAVPGWRDAPRPVLCDDLLPERILAGDEGARAELVARGYRPLVDAGGPLPETLEAWFANGGAIEATARALFVHGNTVRYRLGQIAELTGLTPSQPRDALALQLALLLGRQGEALAGPTERP